MASKRNPHDKRRLTWRKVREWGYGYLFIAPWLVGVIVFFIYAMVQSLRYSVSRIVFDGGVVLYPLTHWYDNFEIGRAHV